VLRHHSLLSTTVVASPAEFHPADGRFFERYLVQLDAAV
jgi:hypothetical protein